MSTFLEIAEDYCDAIGVTRVTTTVLADLTRPQKKYIGDIQGAWMDLQNERGDWGWMWRRDSFNTTADAALYTPDATVIARFDKGQFTAYLTADGVSNEYPLTYAEWPIFWRNFGKGVPTSGAPRYISERPDGVLHLYPPPSAVYTIGETHYVRPTEMSGNSDTPGLPARFHNIILYRALKKYARRENAPEILIGVQEEWDRLERALERDEKGPTHIDQAAMGS